MDGLKYGKFNAERVKIEGFPSRARDLSCSLLEVITYAEKSVSDRGWVCEREGAGLMRFC